MMKIWLKTRSYNEFFLGEIQEKFFNLNFSFYRKKEKGENEYVVFVPFDVYQYYFKCK